MNAEPALPAWKDELAAIIGARAHGQAAEILPRLREFDERRPNIAEINYQLGWTCESLGQDAEAQAYYEKAIALGLSPNELSGALLGLGLVLSRLGQLERAGEILRSGRAQFPGHREFDVFLALALHRQGRPAAALRLVLELLCDTTEDPGLTSYQRTIRYEAGRIE